MGYPLPDGHAILFCMITDADITKLKKTFVTKDDFKKELKKELKKYATKDDLKEAIADVRADIGELDDKFDRLSDKFDSFEVKLDKIVGGLEHERLENAAGAVHLARHDLQIETLAFAIGVALPD